MTDQERLERIKEIQQHANLVYENGDPAMELHDIVIELWEHEHTDWLINQAEENQRLREALEEIRYFSESKQDEYADLETLEVISNNALEGER